MREVARYTRVVGLLDADKMHYKTTIGVKIGKTGCNLWLNINK